MSLSKRLISLAMALIIAFTLGAEAFALAGTGRTKEIPQYSGEDVLYAYTSQSGRTSERGAAFLMSEASPAEGPSGETHEARVTYEVITLGKAAEEAGGLRSALIRFTLKDPGEGAVSLKYKAVSGSAGRLFSG